MSLLRLQADRYIPTAARSGNNAPSVFRATNMFIRGRGDNVYAEVYGGSLDLSETIPCVAITGTISFSPTSKVITGSGTVFTAELHRGQKLETLAGEVISVEEVTGMSTFIAHSTPLTTEVGAAAYRLPVLFELDKKRGSLRSGNALEFDKGTILAVGDGELYVNGALLNASLVASKNPVIAIYDPNTDTYLIQPLGFQTEPAGITISAVAAPVAFTVTVSGDTLTSVGAHGLSTGTAIRVSSTANTPTPLTDANTYYAIVTGANTLKTALNMADARVGVAIPLTDAGTGIITVTPQPKVMPAGDRSLRIAKASSKLGTPTFGNPGIKLKTTIAAGQNIQISFPAMDSNADANNPHDSWRIYGSAFGGTAGIATANADSGAWYYIRTVTSAELGTTGAATYNLDYLDAEIDGILRLATFDNDYPVDAEFVGTVAGYPVLVSCQGKPTLTRQGGTSPGSSIVPFKPANLAAAPLILDSGQRNEVPLSPPEIIIGQYMAAGRLYLMTANTLQIAIFTPDVNFPVTTRPFWKAGFKNPHALCFVNGRLYGFTSAGAMRSVADGEEGSEEHAFAADVEEIMKGWDAERVFVVHDPQNECVNYCYSASEQNADGFWETEILPFMLRSETWSPSIILTDTTRDMLISGVATVNGHFEFLAGGRDGLGGIDMNTYRFDTSDGSPVSYSMAWQFSDASNEDRPKKVKALRVTGALTDANFGIHGASPGENISVTTLEAGNAGSKSGAISLASSTGVEFYPREDFAVQNLMVFTPNIVGTWDGISQKDRIDEVVVEYVVTGGRK